jgi:hypothetical protein
MSATTPVLITSLTISAAEKRLSGTPRLAGNSQAIALTSAST